MRRMLLLSILVFCFASQRIRASVPALGVGDVYLDLITTYCVYAKTIWHDAAAPDVGGWWGPGIGEPNKNGAVRGMTDTALAYAVLVYGGDHDWLSADLQKRLTDAGLSRAVMLQYIRANTAHICAHHLSAPKPLEPTWGFSWQSAMWTGNAGPAVLLVWEDLSPESKKEFKRVAFSEADRIVAKPPKDYKPGDTGAEENGWDSYAPAVALALDPKNPRAEKWMKALKIYAVNTYSTKNDREDPQVREFVSTANLFDDFTLENHGFFHPDYVQVSGQELGDSLLCLELGDRIHGTHLAEDFRPYAMHHVKDVWEKVARPLVLPTGEFALPNSTDWQFNSSQMPAYFGFIAAELNDPVAFAVTQRQPGQALRHRELSPRGRILGDTNMEWFWEPILAKRMTTSLLHLSLHPQPGPTTQALAALDTEVMQRYFPEVKVWLYRNANYFASAAWGPKRMGTFYPFVAGGRNPYLTLPIEGILPADVETYVGEISGDAQILSLKLHDERLCYLICLPYSVVWISPRSLRSLSIENDKLSGAKRELISVNGHRTVPALTKNDTFAFGPCVNIDQTLGLITAGAGFKYTTMKNYVRRSAAYDQIVPVCDFGAWQMIPNINADETARLAADFSAELKGDVIKIHLRDGSAGKLHDFVLPVR